MGKRVNQQSYVGAAWWSLALIGCLAAVRFMDFLGVFAQVDQLTLESVAEQPAVAAETTVQVEVFPWNDAAIVSSLAELNNGPLSNPIIPQRNGETPPEPVVPTPENLPNDVAAAEPIAWIDPQAQLFVYELNLARHDPQTYALSVPIELGDIASRPPLAINGKLVESAHFHAQEMAAHDYFDHQSRITGDWPNKLARNQGYRLPLRFLDDSNQIESLAGGQSDAKATIDQLVIDEGIESLGHRKHLLGIDRENAANREIGVGYANSTETTYRHYWAIHSTRNDAPGPLLTGVVYADENRNGRYDLNEGLAGVMIRSDDQQTHTNSAGGWSITAQSETNHLVADLPLGRIETEVNIVDNNNLEVDFSHRHGAVVNFR